MGTDGWHDCKLKDLPLEFIDGDRSSKYPKKAEFQRSGFLFLNTSNIVNNHLILDDANFVTREKFCEITKARLQPNDVVIATRGNGIGKAALFACEYETGLINAQTLILRAREGSLCPRFLYYLVISPRFQLTVTDFASGSAQPQIPIRSLREIPVSFPPLFEQRAIAEVLGSLDDKIELNRRMNRTLEQMAAAIFKAWFVDFEPVQAKAAGATRFPTMPQPVFDALPTEFTDSPLGPIPKGWEAVSLSDVATLSKESLNPSEFPEEVFDHFSIPAFDDGQRAARDAGQAIKSNKFVVPDYCVLISKLNPRFPRIWLPPKRGQRRQIASTEFLVTLPKKVVSREFLFCLASSAAFRDAMLARVTGTSGSHQRVKPTDFLAITIVAPPSETLAGFTDFVSPLFEYVENNRHMSVTLAAIRDAPASEAPVGRNSNQSRREAGRGGCVMADVFSVYCDESCHLLKDESQVMVLGCLWCLRDRVPEISSRLREIKAEHGLVRPDDYADGHLPFELKWQKVSPAKLAYYLRVVDYFFDDDDLHFRGVIIPDKRILRHDDFQQDHDTWYYKMCFRMLETIIDPQHRFHVYLDIKDTRSEEKRRKLEEVLRNSRYDYQGRIIERVQQIRSHESELLQLADLLIGAICYHNRGLETSPAKQKVIERIQHRSRKSLTHTTWLREPKLNLLHWVPAERTNG